MSEDNDKPTDESEILPQYGGAAVTIEDEMRRSYLDYAMSVIVSRAIPDLRDGLKPVHRRILYSMHESGYEWNKPYRKSARVVGDVIGKYHPHGDQAVYDALVRMAQSFSMRAPLLDGQGNFGSTDGDQPAAMRYTEVRMQKLAAALIADIEQDTVDFQPNYDGLDQEPIVLPARFPHLFVNGAGGIAVGMATNIPPHNLGEIIDATLALIDDSDLEISDLMSFVPGPDFPTGGIILGNAGAHSAYHTGRGSVLVRARTRIEEIRKDRIAIIADELPYQVNKAALIERIAELARDKRIEGISQVRDESNRFGVRVVIELKRKATAEVVLNQLYRFTPMQGSFGMNVLALNRGKPEQLDLKRYLTSFIHFREEVVTRRTFYALGKARDRAHILCGLSVAVANVDEVVKLIRGSATPQEARQRLLERTWEAQEIASYIRLVDDPASKIAEDGTYRLSEIQVRAILDLRLQRLTALGQEEIGSELKELSEQIHEYLDILGSTSRIHAIIAAELKEIKEEFASPRRSEIIPFAGDLEDEDLIENEDMVVSVTHGGYVKRTPLADYRAQRRGGKGLMGMTTKDEDFVTRLFVADTHTAVLVFTTDGMVYKSKVWRFPAGGRVDRGKAVINMFPIETGVSIAALMPVQAPEKEWNSLHIVFATSAGHMRRNELSDFLNVRSNGKIAMKLPESVRLVSAAICKKTDDILLTSRTGKAIRFPVDELRVFKGRGSTGVRAIRLGANDEVVSMSILSRVECSLEEARSYLKLRRRMMGQADTIDESENQTDAEISFSQEQYTELSAHEQMILIISSTGYGKLTSAYEFRSMHRGGQGVIAMGLDKKGGSIAAAFPVENDDQIMLVTDSGQSIRCPIDDISSQSRAAAGVRIFNMAAEEKVVSVARLMDFTDENLENPQQQT